MRMWSSPTARSKVSRTAVKLGTESLGDFRDIHFSNCVIRNTSVGIGFYLKDGAVMERVSFSNMSIETADPVQVSHVVFPIFMDIEQRHADSQIGAIRDVTFNNIQVGSGSGILIQGMPESLIENLTIRDLNFRVERADSYDGRTKAVGGRRTTGDDRDVLYARQPSYVALAYVRNLMLDNVRVTIAADVFREYERSAVSGHGLQDGTIRGVSRSPAGGSGEMPVVALQACRSVSTMSCGAALSDAAPSPDP